MNDTKPKKGGWSGRGRGAAISRLITKKFGVKPNSNHSLISVSEDNGQVHLLIYADTGEMNKQNADDWMKQIVKIVEDAGYDISSVRDHGMTISKPEWRFRDMVFTKLSFTDHHYLESDSELVKAPPRVVQTLRDNQWIKPDTLELTELGQQVRAFLIKLRRQTETRERYQRKQYGW